LIAAGQKSDNLLSQVRRPVVSITIMLPQAAVDLLRFDLVDADALADQGDIEAGQRVLRAGLTRAEGALREGQPWADVLIRFYQEAMDRYSERYPCQPPVPPEEGQVAS
jgi:hypothetical protein